MKSLVALATVVFLSVLLTPSAFAQTKVKKTTKTHIHKETVIEPAVEPTPVPSPAPVPSPTPLPTTEPGVLDQTKQAAHDAAASVENAVANAGDRRAQKPFSAVFEYSPLDLIIPSKIGGAVGYDTSRHGGFELEYLGGAIGAPFLVEQIGGFTDQRVSLLRRSFGERNSFNLFYGLSYFDLNIHVGNKYLQSASGIQGLDLLRSQTLGAVVGIGNRWVFPYGIIAGVDWISVAQPLITLNQQSDIIAAVKDESAKSTLEHVFHLSTYCPRIALLKVAIGLSF